MSFKRGSTLHKACVLRLYLILVYLVSGASVSTYVPPPQEWLVKVCRGAGLEWVEDQTNAQLIYWRNAVRQVLVGHPELFPGLQRLSGLCEEARGIMNRAGRILIPHSMS